MYVRYLSLPIEPLYSTAKLKRLTEVLKSVLTENFAHWSSYIQTDDEAEPSASPDGTLGLTSL